MKSLVVACVVLAPLLSVKALAQDAYSGLYVNVGTIAHHITDFQQATINARFGFRFNENYGVEIEGGTKFASDRRAPVTYNYGFYGLAHYQFSEDFGVFARAGFAGLAQDTYDYDGATNDSKTSALALGVGAQYMLTPFSGVRIDLSRIGVADTRGNFAQRQSFDTLGFHYVYKF